MSDISVGSNQFITGPCRQCPDKVTGKAKYAADLGMPGTMYGRVVRPGAFGAKLKSIDTSAAEKTGVKVVRDGEFVALVGEKPDLVDKALELGVQVLDEAALRQLLDAG